MHESKVQTLNLLKVKPEELSNDEAPARRMLNPQAITVLQATPLPQITASAKLPPSY